MLMIDPWLPQPLPLSFLDRLGVLLEHTVKADAYIHMAHALALNLDPKRVSS